MKKIQKYIAIAVLCFGLTACLDILDTAPYNQVGTANMWTTVTLTEMGVNAVYGSLRNWGVWGTTVPTGLLANHNGLGQFGLEMFGPLAQTHSLTDVVNGNFSANSSFVVQKWRRLYEGVHRANSALFHLPASPVSETRTAQLMAEVRILRAFFYFRLNELWRGVPWYDAPVAPEHANRPRETEQFIWERIIEDLTAAINEEHLPDIDHTSARVTRGVAYALRGRVHMQMSNWQAAAADFARVGQMGHYLFQGCYGALFTEANERVPEMIFSVENIEEVNRGSLSHQVLGHESGQGIGWGTIRISNFAVSLYENLDGTPFCWDDHLPWSSTPIRAREVFFLRDTLNADGVPLDNVLVGGQSITFNTTNRLNQLRGWYPDVDFDALYLPHGNEARMRAIYASRDPRLNKNVITPYSEFLGLAFGTTNEFTFVYRWPFRGEDNVLMSSNGAPVGDMRPHRTPDFEYLFRKFVYTGFNGPDWSRYRGAIDDPLIRYADVLLMWAEALVELNDLSGAMALVAQVRDRVGMPTLAVNFANQETARNYVRDERRREMLGEGGAFLDELRWGTLRETTFSPDEYGPRGDRHVWGSRARGAVKSWPHQFTGDRMVWPIPRVEIERNPNLVQNPGWPAG